MKMHYRAVYQECGHEEIETKVIPENLLRISRNIMDSFTIEGCKRQSPCFKCGGLLHHETFYLTPVGVLRIE